ncbi:hypothetical protein BC830DRAFT_113198 [Chytriomyces sp. MP71]|nr:hypothetical protein BC830DRAFT_113198 [Chytriomyces sp. MP71]
MMSYYSDWLNCQSFVATTNGQVLSSFYCSFVAWRVVVSLVPFIPVIGTLNLFCYSIASSNSLQFPRCVCDFHGLNHSMYLAHSNHLSCILVFFWLVPFSPLAQKPLWALR